MTIRFGNQNFPDTMDEYFKDRSVFFAAFVKFGQASNNRESFSYLLDRLRNKQPQQLFSAYFMKDEGAFDRLMEEAAGGKKSKVKMPTALNITGNLHKAILDLAVANDWSSSSWNSKLADVDMEIKKLLFDDKVVEKFCKAPVYLKLVEEKMFPAVKSAAPKVVRNGKLTQHKGLEKDRKLVELIKFAEGAALLGKKGHPKASGMNALAKKIFESLRKDYGLKLKYEEMAKIIKVST